MIEFTKSYRTGDGQDFGSIIEEQEHELIGLMRANDLNADGADAVAKFLLAQKEAVIDILTMTPNSKPKARKTHGGTKVRTKKTVITDATTSVTTSQNDPATDAQ